jgi:hypothetical protein
MLGASTALTRAAQAAFLACALLLLAAPAAWAGTWLSPQDLSASGKDAIDPRVAMADSGETVVVWEREGKDPFSNTVQASTRAPGAPFSAPIDLSLPSQDPELAMSPAGEAVVAWWHRVGSFNVLQVEFRPPGGSFSAPVEVITVPLGSSPPEIQLAVSGSGDVVLAWIVQVVPPPTQEEEEEGETPDPEPAVAASYRPGGGGISEPEIVSPQPFVSGEFAASPDVAVAGNGDAIVVWTYGNASPEPSELPERATEAAVRPSGSGSFDNPEEVSEGAGFAAAPAVAMDAGGNASAIWRQEEEGATFTIRAASAASGEDFGSPDEISAPGEDAFGPQVALTPGGAATAAWVRAQGDEFFVQASSHPRGGSFPATAANVTPSGEELEPTAPELALSSGDTAALTWSGEDSGASIIKASLRAGGSFSAPEGVSPTSDGLFHPDIAIDATGNTTVAWHLGDGLNEIAQAAGYDAAPPQMRGLSVPLTGTVGVPVAFSALPFDVWPLASTSFTFGDGGGASGTSVSHTYSAPGVYQVTATAVDAAGTPVSASGTIAISPSYEFKIGKQKRNKKKGTATLTVNVSGPGQVAVSGKKVKRRSKRASAAGSVTLAIAAKGKAQKQLNKKGKAKVRVTVTFTPVGGDHAATGAVSVTLKKK